MDGSIVQPAINKAILMEKISKRRLIVVSNRLPFQLQEKKKSVTMRESDGGLVSALKSFFESEQNKDTYSSSLWIGSADFPQERWKKYNENPTPNPSFEVEPIFIETKTYNRFYNGFCNATIWPLFHYFPSIVEFDEETFQSYQEVNNIFATNKPIEKFSPHNPINFLFHFLHQNWGVRKNNADTFARLVL